LQGTVLGIARGITDQDNKDGPELLSSINPTFTWVRLAQRIPVGIHLTHVPPGVLISAGMTCTVVMKEGAGVAYRLDRFGFVLPILTDAEQRVVAGWGLVLAARQIGLTEVPAVSLTDLSEAELRTLRLALNRMTDDCA
jgi:hypothetical protein